MHFRTAEANAKNNNNKPELEWLQTMVIIYQDWFHFDIKTEKNKEDYEEKVVLPKKKRRKKKRFF